MKIPFSLPVIDDEVIAEMHDTLTHTGWLTTGPKARALEDEIRQFTGGEAVLCVNSWTSGAMLMLRWLGVGPGDEVIIPAYTYSATALCAMNMGAKVVMVDVKDDFTIDPEKIKAAINEHTKVILPVDIGGYPCDYDAIREVLNDPEVKALYRPASGRQKQLGRIMLLADAAHSLGAFYKGKSFRNRGRYYRFLPAFRKKYNDRGRRCNCIEFTAAFRQSERTDLPEGFGIERTKQECFRKKSGGCVAV